MPPGRRSRFATKLPAHIFRSWVYRLKDDALTVALTPVPNLLDAKVYLDNVETDQTNIYYIATNFCALDPETTSPKSEYHVV